jgi:hypothetical protein
MTIINLVGWAGKPAFFLPKRLFDKFSTGNFYLREQGTGNRKDWGTHKGGLGWG